MRGERNVCINDNWGETLIRTLGEGQSRKDREAESRKVGMTSPRGGVYYKFITLVSTLERKV